MTVKLTPNEAKLHTPRLVLSHNVHHKVHGDGLAGRINTRIAVVITKLVGSMWCAYLFALIAMISLPAAISSHNPLIMVSWIAQTFLQLVLLPIIIVGQNIQAKAADARAEQTFKDAEAVLHEAQQIQAHLAIQDEALERLADKLGVELEHVRP